MQRMQRNSSTRQPRRPILLRLRITLQSHRIRIRIPITPMDNPRGRRMKIIHIHEVRIIMNSRTEYKIQTPLGILTDINDAVELYPYLIEDKKVNQCPICKRYFIKYGREDNAKKYCSEECSRRGNINNTTENYYNRIFVNPYPFRTDYYTQQLKDTENRQADKQNPLEYHQDDTYWGLGTGNLKEHCAHDPDREKKYVRNELKKLGLV